MMEPWTRTITIEFDNLDAADEIFDVLEEVLGELICKKGGLLSISSPIDGTLDKI